MARLAMVIMSWSCRSHARFQAANKLFNSQARLPLGAELAGVITALLHRAELRPSFSSTIYWTLASSRDG